jgi:hypothetical protein
MESLMGLDLTMEQVKVTWDSTLRENFTARDFTSATNTSMWAVTAKVYLMVLDLNLGAQSTTKESTRMGKSMALHFTKT